MHATVRFGLLGSLLVLAACAGREPIVDRLNVDDAKYNRDLADCKARSSGLPLTNSVSDCLKGKGYRVLMGG